MEVNQILKGIDEDIAGLEENLKVIKKLRSLLEKKSKEIKNE